MEVGRDVCRDGTFAGTGRLPGQDVCRDRRFAGTGRLSGQDDCRDRTIAGAGRLPGRDVCPGRTFCRSRRERVNVELQHFEHFAIFAQQGTFNPPLKKVDRTVDWKLSAEEVAARVRMSDSSPGAVATLLVKDPESDKM